MPPIDTTATEPAPAAAPADNAPPAQPAAPTPAAPPAQPAATPPAAAAPPAAPGLSWSWEDRGEHDAAFITPKKGEYVGGTVAGENGFVEATVIGARLSSSANGVGVDQVDLVYVVSKGSLGLRDGDGSLSDVGGEIVFQTASLNGGALDITLKALARSGYDPHKALEAYKSDPIGKAVIQRLTAAGEPKERIAAACGMLAIQRAGADPVNGAAHLRACGLGSQRVRMTVKNDTYRERTRRRVEYINGIPAPATTDDVLKLLQNIPGLGGPIGGKAATPARKPAGQTSAAPSTAGQNTDDLDF